MSNYYSLRTPILVLFFLSFIFSPKINGQTSCNDNEGVLTVVNTNDTGLGSLRYAINCANVIAGPDTIRFDIQGIGQHVIFVGSQTGEPLPNITNAGTVIDGSTQPGYNGQPIIILDGTTMNSPIPANGITITINDCEIYGLEIRGFMDDGIEVMNGNNTKIGAIGKGNVIYGNGAPQDFFQGYPGVFNGSGIYLHNNSSFCQIQSNKIGTDFDEFLIAGNEQYGIRVENNCTNILIGGTNLEVSNTIANHPQGIVIDNSFGIGIRKNKIYCNQTSGIELLNNGNFSKTPPLINNAQIGLLAGTAPSGDEVDIFLVEDIPCTGVPCQGKTYLGTATSNGGSWVFLLPTNGNPIIQSGMRITAITTTPDGTSSPFSTCETLVDVNSCAELDGTIWVTNTNDDGTGSLRSAIHCANNVTGPNTIKFDIPDSTIQHRIFIGSTSGLALPAILDAGTILDATTQPGFGVQDFSPKIVLDGSQNNWDTPINAIWIRDDFCEVYGFEIVNFPDDGIDMTGANNAIIGAPNKGNVIYNNGYEQDFFPGLPNTGPWNGCGVVLRSGSSFCKVQGNIIGTNYTQDSTGGNEFCGVIFQGNCFRNLIGGSGVGEGNIIAYNEVGVEVRASSSQCRIQQNEMYCNDDGIELTGNANLFPISPVVDSAFATVVYGKGKPGDFIEVFINDTTSCPTANCQGKIFLGQTVVMTDSFWILNPPFSNSINALSDGQLIAATSTDSLSNTSEFSNCKPAIVDCDEFVISFENVENAACGLAFGSFEVVPMGGTPPYEYDYGNGPTSDSIRENLLPGWYYVTVTEAGVCVVNDSIQILAGDSPTLSVSEIINESCDMQNGAISLSTIGGVPPFVFDIGNGGQPDSTFENLSAGVYNITLTDGLGCDVTVTAEVENTPAPFLAVSNLVNENCGMADGGFTVNPFGGTAPIQYDIGNGNTSNSTFSGLSSGLYTVTATDNRMCTATVSVVVFDVPPILPFVINQNNASCNQSNGSFEITVSGGLAPYTFDYGNGPTSNNVFSNLAPGNYTVTITDSPGCFTTVNAQVDNNDTPTFSIINAVNEDCGQMNGSFEIVATGGVSPYQYNIGSGNVSNPVFNNLSAGTYSIVVTDANGCSVTESFVLNENNVTLNITAVENTTCGFMNGSIMFSTTGGTLPYTYFINGVVASSADFINLSAGTYNITVVDAAGCMDSQSVVITDLGSPTFSVINIQNENCGQTDGSLEVAATGGLPPYSYSVGGSISTNPIYTNLNSGFYNIIVTDVNGCTASQVISLGENNVELNIDNISDAICGLNNGTITVTATNGTAPYLFDIGNGNTTNNTFINLAAGTYNITVTDNFGCTDIESTTLQGFDAPTFSIINIVNENCGQSNGSFEIGASGGLPPYQYNIGTGNSSNPIFNNLSAGTYNITLTDANGCVATQNVTLLEDVISLNIDNIQNATCGQANGSITVSTTNGISPIVFDIGNGPTTNNVFDNLLGGTYNITVTDGNGCSDDQTVGLLSTDGPTISIINILDENCGQSDGTFEVDVVGGTSPYTYDIGSGGQSNPVFDNLAAGNYTVVVTDASGCSNTQIFSLDENTVTLLVNGIEHPSCGLANGSFSVTPSGGTLPYTFDIGNGPTSNNVFLNLAGGLYNITLTDANGCTDVQTADLQITAAPTVSITNVIGESCNLLDGGFTVNGMSGELPYTYDIGNGTTSNNIFTNLAAGTYQVTLTDASSCTTTQSVDIQAVGSPSLTIGDVFNATCGNANGAISLISSGGAAPYTYDFGSGPTASNTATNLTAGTYTVTISDDNSCTGQIMVDVMNVGIDPVSNFTFSNNLLTTDFTNISSNADSYIWDFGDGNTSTLINPSHTYAVSGSYEVCLFAINGCGSDTTCQNISAIQPDDVFFDMSEVSGEVGDTVLVAVTVENFNDIISFQKSIHIADITVGKFIGVSNLNLPDLDGSDFSISDGTITADWATGNAGATVGNGTTIYEIQVELQFKLECTPLTIDGNPLPLVVSQNINNNNITIGSQVSTGDVCVNGILGSTVDIAGIIFKENGQTVANVDVTCTNTSNPNYSTTSTGFYEYINLPEGGSYTVTPFKNDAPFNGLTGSDLSAIQQHIVGVNLLDSPYKWIAADANNSGTITALDLVAIQDVIIGNTTSFPNNTSWRFVPEDYIFPNLNNPLSPAFPEEIILNNLLADSLTENFIAVKIGDVNLTSTPSLTNDPSEDLLFVLDKQGITKSKEIVIDVKVKNYNNIHAWQMDFAFDVDGLEFEGIENSQLPNFDSYNIGHTFLERGILPMVWFNPDGQKEGVTIEDGVVIFSLKFKTKRGFVLDEHTFGIRHDRISHSGFKNGKNVNVKVLLQDGEEDGKLDENMWVKPNRPNPFNQFTEIEFYLPKSDKVKFIIFDQTGREVEAWEKAFDAGTHKINIDETILPEMGLYFYQLQTIENHYQGKMIFMK